MNPSDPEEPSAESPADSPIVPLGPDGPTDDADAVPPLTEPAGPAPDADAAWNDIVAHFGERATLETDELIDPTVPGSPRGIESLGDPEDHVGLGVEEVSDLARDPDETFTPPPPPRVTMPEPRRLLAWLGLLGVPALVVLAVLLQVHLPVWGGFALMCWFIGGFTYLVGTMRPGPRDDWDDGAVL